MITVFSFLMSVIFSSAIALLVHLFRKNSKFIFGVDATTIVAVYLLSIVRAVFPMELPFVKVVHVEELYNSFIELVYLDNVGDSDVSIFSAFLVLWVVGAIFRLVLFVFNYFKACKHLSFEELHRNSAAYGLLSQIKEEMNVGFPVALGVCRGIHSPVSMGLFKKKVLLPDKDYTDIELKFILRHELIHFMNKDLFLKFVVRLFTCIFWWNPLAYLLERDITQMMEIRCDMMVTEGMDKKGKARYLAVMLKTLKDNSQVEKKMMSPPEVSTGLFQSKEDFDLQERFKILCESRRKSYALLRITSILVAALIFLASYTVIFQTRYDAPMEDIVTDDNAATVDATDAYLLKHKNGTYSLVFSDGSVFPIEEESFNVMKDHHPVKEE